jgi:hypothetical protein
MGKTWAGALLPATITANQEDIAYPAANLNRPQVRGGDRYHSDDLGIIQIDADLGSITGFNGLALLYTNASPTAGIRWKAAQTQAKLTTDPVLDSVPFGAALLLDGVDDFALAIDASYSSLTSWSISCRFKPRIQRRQGIMSILGSGGTGAVLSQRAGDGAVRFYGLPGLDGNLIGPVPPTDAFTRVTGAYDAGTQTMTFIVNGVLVGTATSVAPWLVSPTVVNLGLGGSADDFLDGVIDDVRLWNYARTPAQEYAEALVEITTFDPGLVGYWKLNDGLGTTGINSVAGASMTLAGPAWHIPSRLWASPALDEWGIPSGYRHSQLVIPVGVGTARWVRCEVIDSLNPEGRFTAGRLAISPGWISEKGRRFGDRLGSSEVTDQTPLHGATAIRGNGLRRYQKYTLLSTSVQEAIRHEARLRYALGSSRPGLVMHDFDDETMRHWQMNYGPFGERIEVVTIHDGRAAEIEFEIGEM